MRDSAYAAIILGVVAATGAAVYYVTRAAGPPPPPPPPGGFSVTVVGPTGAPLAGANVQVASRAGQVVFNGTTDASGTASTGQTLTPGQYTIQASLVGYVPSTVTTGAVSGSTTPLSITLQPASAVLTITTRAGGVAVPATVQVLDATHTTIATGISPFTVGLGSGQWYAQANYNSGGHAWAIGQTPFTEPGTAGLNLDLVQLF